MSRENLDLVRWAFAEFGSTRDGVEKAARSGLIAPDAEIDFSAVYRMGRSFAGWRRGGALSTRCPGVAP
jgi:hypothetical protein